MAKPKKDPDKLDCVVEYGYDVRRIEIIRHTKEPDDEEQPYSVYIDNDLDDGVRNIAEIVYRYGPLYWDDLADYRKSYPKGKSLAKWLTP